MEGWVAELENEICKSDLGTGLLYVLSYGKMGPTMSHCTHGSGLMR